MAPFTPDGAPHRESDGAHLAPIELNTHHLPGAHQFGAFRGAYHGVLDIHLSRSRSTTFPVRQKVWNLGSLVLVRAELPGPGYVLGWRHATRPTLDHWYVLLPLGGAPAAAGPDEAQASFHCLAEPFLGQVEAHGMLMLFMPRELFSWAVDLDGLLNREFCSGASALLADFLSSLARRLARLRPSDLPGIVDATQRLVAVCAASATGPAAQERDPGNMRLLERARRTVRRRLADADLSPAALAEELFVSRSRLYRLFEPFGGVAAYIRRQRLAQTRNALLDPEQTRPVFRIAEEWGFHDASAFSRAFKLEFGLSPTEARQLGDSRLRIRRHGGETSDRTEAPSLETMLRRLHA